MFSKPSKGCYFEISRTGKLKRFVMDWHWHWHDCINECDDTCVIETIHVAFRYGYDEMTKYNDSLDRVSTINDSSKSKSKARKWSASAVIYAQHDQTLLPLSLNAMITKVTHDENVSLHQGTRTIQVRRMLARLHFY